MAKVDEVKSTLRESFKRMGGWNLSEDWTLTFQSIKGREAKLSFDEEAQKVSFSGPGCTVGLPFDAILRQFSKGKLAVMLVELRHELFWTDDELENAKAQLGGQKIPDHVMLPKDLG